MCHLFMLVISLCFSYAKLIMLGGLNWSNLPAKYNADIHYPVSILILKMKQLVPFNSENCPISSS